MKQPDMPLFRNLEVWEKEYQDLINEYLEQKYLNKEMQYDVEIAVNYYPYLPVNEVFTSEFYDYIANTFGYWANSTFDLGIFDDRMLYSEFALMESDVVRGFFNSRKPSMDHLVDLTSYIKKEELTNNDPEILEHSYHDGHIYALPYERDYDILYYINQIEKSNFIANSMETLDWENFLVLMNFQTEDPLAVPLGDDDDLLNFFFEYVNSKYDTSTDEDKNYYDQFVNDKARMIFKDFRDFVVTYSKNKLNHTIRIGYDEAYAAFLEGQLSFYKGRASHYQVLLRDFEPLPGNSTDTENGKSSDNNGNENENKSQENSGKSNSSNSNSSSSNNNNNNNNGNNESTNQTNSGKSSSNSSSNNKNQKNSGNSNGGSTKNEKQLNARSMSFTYDNDINQENSNINILPPKNINQKYVESNTKKTNNSNNSEANNKNTTAKTNNNSNNNNDSNNNNNNNTNNENNNNATSTSDKSTTKDVDDDDNNKKLENTNSKVFSAVLPPKKYSTITEKYLALNKYSKIDQKVLVEVARVLTSKEMQLLRASKFGCVPALDLTKKTDPDIKSYCDEKAEICDGFEQMKRINLKKIFESEYQTPFFEIRLLLPSVIRNFIINGTVEYMTFGFKNIKEMNTTDMGIYGYLSYGVVSIFVLVSLVIILLTYKHRNHPYVKAISPLFCNLMCIGFIMSMISLLMFLPPYSITKSKISYMYDIVNICLIVIPMVFITYRIYYIFRSESVVSRRFTNKQLSLCIGSSIIIVIIYKIYIIYKKEFYYIPFGLLNENPRFPQYYYDDFYFHDQFDGYFSIVLYIIIVIMIVLTGKISKKFGNFSFIYAIIFKNIIDYFAGRLLVRIRGKKFPLHFFLFLIFYCFVCFLCVYILVGSRVLFVILYPSKNGGSKGISTKDLMDFVPLKINKNQYLDLFKKIEQNRNVSYNDFAGGYNKNSKTSNPNIIGDFNINNNFLYSNNSSNSAFNNSTSNSTPKNNSIFNTLSSHISKRNSNNEYSLIDEDYRQRSSNSNHQF